VLCAEQQEIILGAMCRWMLWCSGEPIPLADVVLEPSNSLIHQSFNGGYHPGLNNRNNMPLNADGFGIGWYNLLGSAAIFRSVTPAWNNRNLRELCNSVQSTCIFAHVRAASPGAIVSEENCHPFRYGRLLFQHNGHLEGFSRLKRRVMAELRDDVYEWVEGTTDSEACFGLVLSLIDPHKLKKGDVPAEELQQAMLGAIALLRNFLTEANITDGYSTFNFALTDGKTVVVTRYCDKAPSIPPPSLYYAFANVQDLRSHLSDSKEQDGCCRGPGDGSKALERPIGVVDVSMQHGCSETVTKCAGGAFICSSEPLTHHTDQWFLITENSMICYQHGDGGAALCVSSVNDPETASPLHRRTASPYSLIRSPGHTTDENVDVDRLRSDSVCQAVMTDSDTSPLNVSKPKSPKLPHIGSKTKAGRRTSTQRLSFAKDLSNERVQTTSLAPAELDLFVTCRKIDVPPWRQRYVISALQPEGTRRARSSSKRDVAL